MTAELGARTRGRASRPDPARYLLVMGAHTFALVQAIHATDDRSPDRMRQLYAAYGATLPA